jgi:hypothetical protein
MKTVTLALGPCQRCGKVDVIVGDTREAFGPQYCLECLRANPRWGAMGRAARRDLTIRVAELKDGPEVVDSLKTLEGLNA